MREGSAAGPPCREGAFRGPSGVPQAPLRPVGGKRPEGSSQPARLRQGHLPKMYLFNVVFSLAEVKLARAGLFSPV